MKKFKCLIGRHQYKLVHMCTGQFNTKLTNSDGSVDEVIYHDVYFTRCQCGARSFTISSLRNNTLKDHTGIRNITHAWIEHGIVPEKYLQLMDP